MAEPKDNSAIVEFRASIKGIASAKESYDGVFKHRGTIAKKNLGKDLDVPNGKPYSLKEIFSKKSSKRKSPPFVTQSEAVALNAEMLSISISALRDYVENVTSQLQQAAEQLESMNSEGKIDEDEYKKESERLVELKSQASSHITRAMYDIQNEYQQFDIPNVKKYLGTSDHRFSVGEEKQLLSATQSMLGMIKTDMGALKSEVDKFEGRATDAEYEKKAEEVGVKEGQTILGQSNPMLIFDGLVAPTFGHDHKALKAARNLVNDNAAADAESANLKRSRDGRDIIQSPEPDLEPDSKNPKLK